MSYVAKMLRLDKLPQHIIDGVAAQRAVDELVSMDEMVRAVEQALHDSGIARGLSTRLLAEVASEAALKYLGAA